MLSADPVVIRFDDSVLLRTQRRNDFRTLGQAVQVVIVRRLPLVASRRNQIGALVYGDSGRSLPVGQDLVELRLDTKRAGPATQVALVEFGSRE